MKSLARLSVIFNILLWVVPFGVLAWILWKIYDLFRKFQKDPQAFVNQFPRIGALLGFVGYNFGGKNVQIPDVTGAAGEKAAQEAERAVYAKGTQAFYNEVLLLAAKNYGFDKPSTLQGTFVWPWGSYREWDAQKRYLAGGYPEWPALPYQDDYLKK